ncbi:MAG: hypothetical protein Q9227_006787 [Pyrenula ochraceoflavens]
MSALSRPPPRSNSRMSVSSRQGGGVAGSRASDEEGRTSVKVAVRVRPPLQPNDPGFDLIPQRFQRSMVQVTAPTSLAVDSPQGRKLFVFDRVFDEDVTQDGVWGYIQDSVSSFLQGYNVSILAYGQSGAGKSYTMGTSGPVEQNDPVNKGIVPRAAALLFDNLDPRPSLHGRSNSGLKTPNRYSVASTSSLSYMSKVTTDKNWQLKATYIYNENLRDLLLPESVPVHERAPVTIREDTKGRILLTGLREVTITSIDELLNALNFGSTIRQTDATAINAKSSRSHAVFSLNLIQKKSAASMMSPKEKRMSVPIESMSGSETTVTIDSKLHFVDLAGSERLKNTGASGERAKEGISINAGLASLGKVISQLSSRQAGSHVSYRDSRLTRLLQDSLGGNAITYMIACVTPAEFHLSETLNTVQYAQRARAIQSKPRIQQVSDEGDKQAVIDRLRTEVAFLRQQIRNASPEQRNGVSHDRVDRQSERENELQNTLLDVQESYTALSQRHAKLIAELTNGGESLDTLNHAPGESAVDRLKRSQANQQQIEQVILEYEKTLQSLESNLSTTRTSLANTESSLMERETKCAYADTMNQQLQSRIQKLVDREANTERYLHELEGRLDGHTSGEEKSSAVASELRKEIARFRENEGNLEDYISTLEERLAEADQDMELMQREVERLEHVVDRQRSLGKLDNLLYELDHIQQNGRQTENADKAATGSVANQANGTADRQRSLAMLQEAAEKTIPEEPDEDLAETLTEPEALGELKTDDEGLRALEKATTSPTTAKAPPQEIESLAQSKALSDKLENVTQELFDLKLEHESTVNEFDLLSAKYQQALHTLAEMQDAVDEARHPAHQPSVVSPTSTARPISFLEDARTNEPEDGGHLSSSRSLSSELSLAGDSPGSTEESDANLASKDEEAGEPAHMEEPALSETERLRKALAEHEEGLAMVTQQYAQLQSEHQKTQDTVERLRIEAQRAKSGLPPPSPTHMPPVIRRMTSQNVMAVDRAHRSLASLRNIAVEEFESRPDTMQSVETHLNTAMHELHSRMERIQSLEAENKNVKDEIERKTRMISGLTRERNSRHKPGTSIDIGAMTQMQEQLLRSESEIKTLQDLHSSRESQLRKEIQNLNASLSAQKSPSSSPVEPNQEHQKIASLQEELSEWQRRHNSALETLKASEERLSETMTELEMALASSRGPSDESEKMEARSPQVEDEKASHQALVGNLKKNIEDYKGTIDSHENTIAVLRDQHKRSIDDYESMVNAHSETINKMENEHRQTLEDRLSAIKSTEDKLSALEEQNLAARQQAERHNEVLGLKDSRIGDLEQEIEEHRQALTNHQEDLRTMRDVHTQEIEAIKKSNNATAEAEYEKQQADLTARHNNAVSALNSELQAIRKEMKDLVDASSETLGMPVTFDHLHEHLEKLAGEREEEKARAVGASGRVKSLEEQIETKHGDFASVEKELAASNARVAEHRETIKNLATEVANHEETLREKNNVLKKKDSNLEAAVAEKQNLKRIVEELEQQIEASFDQHNNRLSVVQAQSSQALVEAQGRIGVLEKELDNYKSQRNSLQPPVLNGEHRPTSPQMDTGGNARTNSMSSNLRKSASAASLPSPPPAIPLPPLPTISSLSTTNGTSPPASRHTSKDLPASAAHLQLIEDQEARIRTIEKHLNAEKQLTATLEEALVDLETQSNKVRADLEGWKKKAWQAEEEVARLGKERRTERLSVQAVEEERDKRREAERARKELEERMARLGGGKKKKSGLNCF